MVTTTPTITESTVRVAGLDLRLSEAGDGPPLLLLHRSIGRHGWDTLEQRLSERFRVLAPDLPGFGESERPDWAREPRDLAIIMARLLERLDVTGVTLVGMGLGGFLAAELATLNEERLSSLVLVSADGLKPRSGEIADQMLMEHADYLRQGLHDEESFTSRFGEKLQADTKDILEFSRIMTARITWSPYMFSRRLAPLLGEVRTPTLVVWGDDDKITPRDCADQYVEGFADARLEIVEGANHFIEWDQPERLAELISAHSR